MCPAGVLSLVDPTTTRQLSRWYFIRVDYYFIGQLLYGMDEWMNCVYFRHMKQVQFTYIGPYNQVMRKTSKLKYT